MMRSEVPPSTTPPLSEAPPPRPPKESRAAAANARHRLVIFSILLFSAALATMLYVQLSATLAGSAVVGLVACIILLLGHEHLRQNAEIARLKKDLARAHGAAGGAGRTAAAPGDSAPTAERDAAPTKESTARLQNQQRRRVNVLAPDQQTPPAAGELTAPLDPPPSEKPPLQPALKLSADPLRDQWAFRPSEPSITPPPPPGAIGASGASTIETDLAVVQRKIKALADEVNATDATRAGQNAPDAHAAALESSIGALRAAGGAMRDARPHLDRTVAPDTGAWAASTPAVQSQPFFEFSIPASAERIATSTPSGARPDVSATPSSTSTPSQTDSLRGRAEPNPTLEFAVPLPDFLASPPRSSRLSAITRAIDAGNMDVWLSPIVGLMNHDVSHYEMKVRLQADDGGYIDDVDGDLILAGNEMLALFDAARLQRAAALARRLETRGKGGSLLSDVAGASMTNGSFLDTFARMFEARERIASQLVLTFAQADCEQFTPSAWQALGDMHAFGFRFALDRLQHLDTDFEELTNRGFAFVKLEAAALLDGMPSRDRFAGSPEICARIAGAGLTLIADAVDSDAMRARLFGFGVLFGQGQLFGGARRVSIDVGESSQAA